jgi:histidyl-tRNA synthetase
VSKRVYRGYGFTPIDTPALEYSEILLGKGGAESDKQLFRFTDQGNRDVSMRFDLTVPCARFAAQHINELGTPFKRYHIATVWRAEKPQKGRYREFMQCDFDTIGTSSHAADIETALVIHDLLDAIGFDSFTIRVNNRLVLNGLLETFDLAEHSSGVLRALDKLQKIGSDKVVAEMAQTTGASSEAARQLLESLVLEGTSTDILAQLEPRLANSESGALGVARLRELFEVCEQVGIPPDRLQLDLSIARGLDYYTGTVFETFLDELPGIGSVCSGGRYDDLAGLFTSQPLPGVGASLGLDRLLAAMEELGMLESSATPASVLVTFFDKDRLGDYLRIGRVLRQAGINAEVFPEAARLGKQLKYADRKEFRVAVVAGENEFLNGTWQVKDLINSSQTEVAEQELTSAIESILGSATKS